MRNELTNGRNLKTVLIALVTFSLLFGAASSLFFEILAPLAAGVYASLVLFDVTPYKLLSVAVPIVLLVANILLGNYVPVTLIMIVALGVVIALYYSKGLHKGECAGWLTAIATLLMLVSLALVAMEAKESFTVEAVTEYFTEIYSTLRTKFVESMMSLTVAIQEGISESIVREDIAIELFDMLVSVSLSILVIVAFVIAGIALKVFSAITARLVSEPYHVYNWRFSTSSLFAYFYVALLILSFIVGSSDPFAICVQNLYNVFLAVYGYIGFNFAYALFSRERSPFFTFAVLVFAILFASTVALILLSLLGVFFTVKRNKDLGTAGGNSDS